MSKVTASILIAALSIGALAVSGDAKSSPDTANVKVTATVLKRTSINVLAQPATVEITTDDIARGYVNIPAATRIEIKSNSPQGFILIFENHGNFVSQTHVSGIGNDVQFGAGGGGIYQQWPGHPVDKTVIEMMFRFILAEGISPGIYAWPIQLSVMPQ